MYRELNPASQREIELNDFALAYREAEMTATLRSLEAGSPGDPSSQDGSTVVAVPVLADTVAFGTVEEDLDLPFDEGGIAWDEALVFPGLRRGEHLESQVELAPARADPRRRRLAPRRGTGRSPRPPARQRRDRRQRRSRHRRRRRRRRARPQGLPARHSGRDQRPRAGLQRQARRQARRVAAGRERGRLGADDRRSRTAAGRAGEDDDRPRPAGIGRLRPSPAASAASPCSTPATATSAPSPARPSRPPSPRARPSR